MPTTRRPRLLFAVHSAKLAGAQIVALGQAEHLAAGHDLVISIGHGPLRPRFEPLGRFTRQPVQLPIWGAPAWRWGLQSARTVLDALRLAAVIRRERLDAVIVNSTVLVAPVLAARLAGVPSIVVAQEAPKSPEARALFRIHGELASTVVAISPWIASAFEGSRANVMLSPVGIPLAPPVPRAPACRERPLRLVVVGGLDRHKRQDLAVAALCKLAERGVDATLTLLGVEGDAAYAAEVRALAERLGSGERVDFAGPTDDVPSHLLRSDVLLVPAGEVTPLVLMEAMAYGTPVVAARMGSIPDVTVDGESGLLVEPDDAGAIAGSVEALARDPERAARLAAAGRERVESHFDQAQSHRRLAAEIARLTGRR
jgi:glycosyltransferase involved in cell wall biosynthesis